MARVHNFSAGPAALPLEVLEEAQSELLDYRGLGMSVLEMSHRSAAYQQIIEEAEETLRDILDIPDTYRVLFLQGGATLEFAGIPLNLMRRGRAGYLVTGNFAKKAWQEAQKYGEAPVLASSEGTSFDRIPDLGPVASRVAEGDLDYVYICQNNTIFGTEYRELPQTGETPLVADVSSCFLSHPLDVERYGLIYAGAQKNMGPSGLAVIIVREDLLGRARPVTPTVLDYQKMADADSMLNTPPTFAIYLLGLIGHWIEDGGGLEAMAERNRAKAELLYGFIDSSDFYANPVQKRSRSWMNVPFTLADPALDADFLAGAQAAGLTNLKGHRSVGGMRASIYNAMPIEGVRALIDYMTDFAARA